jgi:hypothetical protein
VGRGFFRLRGGCFDRQLEAAHVVIVRCCDLIMCKHCRLLSVRHVDPCDRWAVDGDCNASEQGAGGDDPGCWEGGKDRGAAGTELRFVASHPSIRERLKDEAPGFVAIQRVGHPPRTE